MKLSLISICLVVLSYGCSSSSPTAPTFDTTTKEDSAVITIQRWDGEEWIETADLLSVSWTWRFISYLEKDDRSVRIKGGYTLDLSNPSDNDVEFSFNKLSFDDKDGIPIYEYTLIYDIDRFVSANGTDTYSGAFEIDLDNIDVSNQITKMFIWGAAFKEINPLE